MDQSSKQESDRPIRIRRAKHGAENAYFLAARATAQDRALSYEARGVLFYLLSKPGDWLIRVSDIRQKGAGRDKVYRILGELEAHRYLARDFIRNKQGVIVGMEYIAYELPFTEKPDAEKPDTGKPDTGNKEHTEDRGIDSTEGSHSTEGDSSAEADKAQSEREKLGLEKPGEGVLDAICIFLYGDLDGWKLNYWRIQKLYNSIASKYAPPTMENLRAAYKWWTQVDYRGKRGELPEPAQLIEKWSIAIKYKGKGAFNNDGQSKQQLVGKQSGDGGSWGTKTATPRSKLP